MPETRNAPVTPQAFSVKRAQVEFHNFASLGEPERAMRVYARRMNAAAPLFVTICRFIGIDDALPRRSAPTPVTPAICSCNEFGA